MVTIHNYECLERLQEGNATVIYRARVRGTNERVILKLSKFEHPSGEDMSRLMREYDLVSGISDEGIVRAIELAPYRNGYVLVLEDFGGEALQQRLCAGPFSLPDFLEVAIQLARAVGKLHQHKIVHKDIKPKNIIVHPHTRQTKLTDFGIASRFASEVQEPLAPLELEGTLHYMSPEQTGRMNRFLDYRSDIYSLGATFYEMLTGKPPFSAAEPMELIHCHLAKTPVPPRVADSRIPKPLSDMVMKCLEKNAEDRYQSAYGLQVDLERCLEAVNRGGPLPDFPIGQWEDRDVFRVPQRLYGREAEHELLRSAYERIGYGSNASLLVSGQAGTGKSSLIRSMLREVSLTNGLFLSGKFDALQRHVPYSGVITALRGLIHQLVALDEPEAEEWRRRIGAALKEGVRVLMDVLPELEWLVGPQEPPEALTPVEAKNRLHFALLHFFECFAERHRMVLFLDDLQWADTATLQLLHFFMTEAELPSVLFIGSYREEELDQTPTLQWLIGEMHRTRPPLTIELKPLTAVHIQEMINDTIGCGERAHALAVRIMERTEGNPFFVKQFFAELYERRLLWFDYLNSIWQWDDQSIASLPVTDNVIGLIGRKLERLPVRTASALQLAACIESKFELRVLAELLEENEAQTLDLLEAGLQAQLIAPLGSPAKHGLALTESGVGRDNQVFTFLHDKIRSYCYSVLPDRMKRLNHLKLARLQLAQREKDGTDKRLFAVVHHYSLCLSELGDTDERERVASLFSEAGRRAKASAAFNSASRYYEAGLSLLPEECFKEQYPLAFGMHLGLLETSYLNGRFDEGIERFHYLKEKAATRADRVSIYSVMVSMYTQMGNHQKSVSIGMEGVWVCFGIRLDPQPKRLNMLLSLAAIQGRLAFRKSKDYEEQAGGLSGSERTAMLHLMMETATSAYFVNPIIYLSIMLRMVSMSLKYGNSADSSSAYIAYGLLLGSGFGQYEKGYKFARYGLELGNKYRLPGLRSINSFAYGVFIRPWRRHMRTCIDYMWAAFHAGMEAGDLVFAGYSVNYVILMQEFLGRPVHDILKEVDRHMPFLRQTRNPDTVHMIQVLRQVCLNLQGGASDPLLLAETEEGEDERRSALQSSLNQVILYYFYVKKMMLCYWFDDLDGALDMSILAEGKAAVSFGVFHAAEHSFYAGLIAAADALRRHPKERAKRLQEIRRHERRLRNWARHGPENFKHLHLLVRAERLRLTGRDRSAERCYEEAVDHAKAQGYGQFAAVCAERAALFYESKKRLQTAKLYMTEALLTYGRWGAGAKVRQLERTQEHLLLPHAKTGLQIYTPTATTTTLSPSSLDLAAILRVSQAVSEEIVLERLLGKLMEVLMQATGSTRGVLMMKHKDGLFVEAEAEIGESTPAGGGFVRLLQSEDVRSFQRLPLTIIYHTARTQEHQVLSDAARDGLFTADEYIQRHKPRSILCAPIVHQGQLNAMLYLENRLATHAFTRQRRMIVDMLAGQAAISIEHAKFVSLLEEKVRERTEDVMRMEESRRKLLSNISHDLGTPLTSIQGYVEAILDGVVAGSEAQHKYLKVIHSRVMSIQRLMKDLMQLSKMETRQLTLHKTALKAADFVKYLFHKYELDVEKAGLGYELQLHESVVGRLDGRGAYETPAVVVDEERIGQVFSNLIYNAIRHTPVGGGIRVNAKLDFDGSQLLLQIKDTGSGIAEEDLPHIFDRFYRGTKSRTSTEGGSGLGLSIAKEIVQLHDGRIGVESRSGQGSTFFFSLPVVWPDTAKAAL